MRSGSRRSSRPPLRALLAAAALSVAIGCNRAPSRDEAPPAPAPAAAGPVVTIALLPERNVFEQKKRYQPLQAYLSAASGQPVAFKLLDNYQVIFTEILEHRVEGAFFGSMNGAIAQLKGGVEILARPVDLSGRLDLHRRHLRQNRERHHRGPQNLEGQAHRARQQGHHRGVPLPAEPAAALGLPGRRPKPTSRR